MIRASAGRLERGVKEDGESVLAMGEDEEQRKLKSYDITPDCMTRSALGYEIFGHLSMRAVILTNVVVAVGERGIQRSSAYSVEYRRLIGRVSVALLKGGGDGHEQDNE